MTTNCVGGGERFRARVLSACAGWACCAPVSKRAARLISVRDAATARLILRATPQAVAFYLVTSARVGGRQPRVLAWLGWGDDDVDAGGFATLCEGHPRWCDSGGGDHGAGERDGRGGAVVAAAAFDELLLGALATLQLMHIFVFEASLNGETGAHAEYTTTRAEKLALFAWRCTLWVSAHTSGWQPLFY